MLDHWFYHIIWLLDIGIQRINMRTSSMTVKEARGAVLSTPWVTYHSWLITIGWHLLIYWLIGWQWTQEGSREACPVAVVISRILEAVRPSFGSTWNWPIHVRNSVSVQQKWSGIDCRLIMISDSPGKKSMIVALSDDHDPLYATSDSIPVINSLLLCIIFGPTLSSSSTAISTQECPNFGSPKIQHAGLFWRNVGKPSRCRFRSFHPVDFKQDSLQESIAFLNKASILERCCHFSPKKTGRVLCYALSLPVHKRPRSCSAWCRWVYSNGGKLWSLSGSASSEVHPKWLLRGKWI